MKNKFKSYSFWMSVTGAVILVLNNLGKAFGFAVDSEIITQIVDSICGVLILFGIITMTKSGKEESKQDDVTAQDEEKQDETSQDDEKSKEDFETEDSNKKSKSACEKLSKQEYKEK